MRHGSRHTTRRAVVALALAAGAALLLTAGPAEAKKPVRPTEPAFEGTIYLTDAMNGEFVADGAPLFALTAEDSAPAPLDVPAGSISNVKHGDAYWSLYFENVGATYETRRICAVRIDQGTTATRYTLLAPSDAPFQFHAGCHVDWAFDDGAFFFSGFALDASGNVVTRGIYRQDVTWGADGAPTVSGSAVQVVATTTWGIFDQSPGGTYFAHHADDPPSMWMRVLDADFEFLWEGKSGTPAYGNGVQWSPDGLRLAKESDGNLQACDPDGGNQTTVVAMVHKGRSYVMAQPALAWSPDSAHIAYRVKHVQTNARIGNPAKVSWSVESVEIATGTRTEILGSKFLPLAWRP